MTATDAKAPGSDVVESALPVGVAVTSGPSPRFGSDERFGMTLSELEIAALAMYARLGSISEAAYALGRNQSRVKYLLGHAYEKLGVYGAINAFRALGWLRVPEDLA